MDKLTPEQRRKSMQANKSKGTKIEILLGKALFAKGLRYRKNNKKVHGTPDFTITKYKVAIFADGDFWHGKDWENRRRKLGANAAFWFEKIERNMERDFKVNEKLRDEGWTVLRFWESDLKKNREEIAFFVKEIVDFKKQKILESKFLRKQMLHAKKESLIQNYLQRKNDDFPQRLKKTAVKYTREFLYQKYPEEEFTIKVAGDLLHFGAPKKREPR
ncbi:very short patch repair endonuclease [Chryseobacterium koreense]|uniref:very short patch repair endonuclease n=1 Tax=Chryseobacterium koreense TaxID=232216 RepID=UPI0009FD2FD1|nr:very short patch repair endonuclease [Chryseobacterium koreense]MBB5333682.1 DNA mismatch endonuclease Vsr [Chryseobacterium koreense]